MKATVAQRGQVGIPQTCEESRSVSGVFQDEGQRTQHPAPVMNSNSDMTNILSGTQVVNANYVKPSTRVFHPPGLNDIPFRSHHTPRWQIEQYLWLGCSGISHIRKK